MNVSSCYPALEVVKDDKKKADTYRVIVAYSKYTEGSQRLGIECKQYSLNLGKEELEDFWNGR